MTTAQQEKIQERPVASAGRPAEVRKRNFHKQLVSGSATKKSSYKEHRVDALAPYADEGRGKLR